MASRHRRATGAGGGAVADGGAAGGPAPGGRAQAATDVVVVMGVSGSGKTTLGKRLARALRFDFADADAYHPDANVAKMAAGVPLTDADREPWLEALRDLIEQHAAAGRPLVLGCSALKRRYRKVLAGARHDAEGDEAERHHAGHDQAEHDQAEHPAAGTPSPGVPEGGEAEARAARITFVYLRGDYDTILARMRGRQGHYMKADMLASQFRDLEEPAGAVTVDVTTSVPAALGQALAGLARRGVVPAADREGARSPGRASNQAPSQAPGRARHGGRGTSRDEEEDA